MSMASGTQSNQGFLGVVQGDIVEGLDDVGIEDFVILAGVFQDHVIGSLLPVRNFAEPEEAAHAVLRVNNVVAGFQIRKICREGARQALGR